MLLSQLPLPDPDRLTPAEQHVLDKHPEWYTGVQLSMRVTNCATWCLGLHLADRSGATTVTAIRLDPGHANVIESPTTDGCHDDNPASGARRSQAWCVYPLNWPRVHPSNRVLRRCLRC